MVMWRFGTWPSFKAIDECEFAPRRTGLEDVVVVLMREQGGLLYREIKKNKNDRCDVLTFLSMPLQGQVF